MATPSQKIDQYITRLNDWRGERLNKLRTLINGTNSGLEESWKWNAPVWTYEGKNMLALSAFKHHIKIVFFRGATLEDSERIFNSGLDAKNSRTIDLKKDDTVNEKALQKLIIDATIKFK